MKFIAVFLVIMCMSVYAYHIKPIASRSMIARKSLQVTSLNELPSDNRNSFERFLDLIGTSLTQAFSKMDYDIDVKKMNKDLPKFHTKYGKKTWKKYKKHNWSTDDQAKAFATKFLGNEDPAFDYFIVREPKSDIVRVYDSKPTQDENAARYIAFAISQGLSPLDCDPSTPSKPIMPPFKTIKLSKLRKALQEDEFFFER
jgi:hypothetical protein